MKRIIVSSLVGGALALASLGGVLAAPAAANGTATSVLIEHPGKGGRGVAQGHQGISAILIKATIDATGLTGSQVATELKAGKSLEQIAQSKGQTAKQIIDAARASLKTQLDQAVANKRMTQARADEALAQFDSQALKIMQDTKLGQKAEQKQERRQNNRVAAALIKATADVTGLTPAQVRTELKAGKSLEQIAQSKGKTAADILAKFQENKQNKAKEELDSARQLVTTPGLTDTTTP